MKKIVLSLILILLFILAQNTTLAQEQNIDKPNRDRLQLQPNDIYFTPYIKYLNKKIKSNWHHKHRRKSRCATCEFKINKDGSVENLKIYKSSEDEDFDKEALDAIEHSAPFNPLPKQFLGKSITLQFHFDYHVFGH